MKIIRKLIAKEQNNSDIQKLMSKGFSKIAARLLLNRNYKESDVLKPGYHILPDPELMLGVSQGVEILIKHLRGNSHIVLVTDYDADGVLASGVLANGLKHYFLVSDRNMTVIVNERPHGNGVNQKIVEKLTELNKNNPIDLIITADHGSSDEVRYQILKQLDLDIIVTDHHLLPSSGKPVSCDVFINPQQTGCGYSKDISGCAVAFLLLLATLRELKKDESFQLGRDDDLLSLTPLVALSCTTDVMSMRNPINRMFSTVGLNVLQQCKDPIWSTLVRGLRGYKQFGTYEVGFKIGPLLNGAGRMNDAGRAGSFLRARSGQDAENIFRDLEVLNKKRKIYQNNMYSKAVKVFEKEPEDNMGIVLALEEGEGVAGILSIKLGLKHNKPTMILTASGDGTYKGSGRAINKDFHLKEALDNINEKDNSVLIKFGGHAAAAGCSLKGEKIPEFKRLFEEEIESQLGVVSEFVVEADMELKLSEINYGLLESIREAGPYGKDWDYPTFNSLGTVTKKDYTGPVKQHVKFTIEASGEKLETFYIDGTAFTKDIHVGDEVLFNYSVSMNVFLGKYEVKTLVNTMLKKNTPIYH